MTLTPKESVTKEVLLVPSSSITSKTEGSLSSGVSAVVASSSTVGDTSASVAKTSPPSSSKETSVSLIKTSPGSSAISNSREVLGSESSTAGSVACPSFSVTGSDTSVSVIFSFISTLFLLIISLMCHLGKNYRRGAGNVHRINLSVHFN